MNKDTKIVWLAVDTLIPYEHNAKEHTPTQINNIKKSLNTYGWQNPCLITKDNVLVTGHGRILAAKELGLTEAPCIYADDLTDEQIKEYRHLDNLLSEGGYIQSELDYEMQTVDISGYDFSEIDVDLKNVGGGYDYPTNLDSDDEFQERYQIKITFDDYNLYSKIEKRLKELVGEIDGDMVIGTI